MHLNSFFFTFMNCIEQSSDQAKARLNELDWKMSVAKVAFADDTTAKLEKALAQVPALKKIPKYATPDLVWREAELLEGLGRHEEAIKSYRAANRQPHSTWKVADCFQAMKNWPKAIETVRGLESVKATAPQAALRIADIYRASGDKGREVDQLRLILVRYPKSGKWQSEAHNRLESYGVALKGGINEAED